MLATCFNLLFITKERAVAAFTAGYRLLPGVALRFPNSSAFPFAEFPAELEPPEAEVRFN